MNKLDYVISRGISKGMQLDDYYYIYYQTNEDLNYIYQNIDFNNKDVLSVLASGDQAFTSLFLGAKKVDTFDKNKLAIYYYYLRLWSIKYMNMLYPEIDDKVWMYKLLNSVVPSNEHESLVKLFYLRHLKDGTGLYKLFYDYNVQPFGNTLFNSAEDLKDYINNPLKFYYLDLFKNNTIKTKYDIIILSNILEWAKGDNNLLENAQNNIDELLNDDGVVICSSIINERPYSFDKFDCQEYMEGYTYTRKK